MIVVKGRLMMIGHQDQVVAWSGDNLVEVRVFELPRYYNNIDMRDFDFKLDTEIHGIKNIIDLPKTVIGEDNIILVWTIAESHVTIPGRMFIQIRAFSADEEKWHSSQDYVFVQSSINATDVIPDPLPSEFEQMEQRVTAMRNEAQEAEQGALGQANRAQGIADTFSNTTLPEGIIAIQAAGQAKVDLAEVQADRAQGIADEFSDVTLPAAITAVEDAGQSKVDLATKQAGIATTKAREASDSAEAALGSEQAAFGYRNQAEGFADDAEESAEESAKSATIAANNILNGVDTHNQADTSHADIRDEIRTVEAIARGKATAFVFETYTDMMEWLEDPENTAQLIVGDNLYIKDVDVFDYWWTGTNVSPLEAEAPDLTNYYTKTQVDGMMPITISREDYDVLVAAGTVEAGRVYNVIEGDAE